MTKNDRTSSLRVLEAESVHIFREAAATCARPALLFSGGPESKVLVRVAEKAFWPAEPPFPVVRVDTAPGQDPVLRQGFQTMTLLRAIREREFDEIFDGTRREGRAGLSVFSLRDEFGQRDPRLPAEPWHLYHAAPRRLEHVRVFPLANWTERDIRSYLAIESTRGPENRGEGGRR